MIRIIGILAGIVLLVVGSSSVADGRVSKTEEFSISSEISSISLNGYNGAIIWMPIGGEARAHIVVEKEVKGVLAAVMEEFLVGIQIEDHSSGPHMVLHAVQPRRPLGVASSEVRFTVYASPEQIKNFQAQTSNGSITINADFDGSLNLRTSNGSIVLSSGSGEINLRTSNGSIDLGKLNLTDSSTVRTSNGRIGGAVAFPLHGQFEFENSNGRIDLQMPPDTSGSFNLSTSNGNVDFRLGRDIATKQSKVAIYRGQGPSIQIKTSNGNIGVREGDF